MEEDNIQKNNGQKTDKTLVSRYIDILTDDDRALLGNYGQVLDPLMTQIKAPKLDDLVRDFNGE